MCVALTMALLGPGLTAPDAQAAAWHLRYVNLRVAVEPAAKQLRGNTTLLLAADADATDLVLDLADSLTVDSSRVTAPSGAITRGLREPGHLRFSLPGGGRAGSYRAEIWYHGQPARRGVGIAGTAPAFRAASYGLPHSASEWWPGLDDPSQKADSADVWITAPASLAAVSIGRLIERGSTADGQTATTHWATRHPVYPDAISFAFGDYAVTRSSAMTSGVHPVALEFYLFPEDSAKGAADFAEVPAILAFYAERLGPYPFADEKYALVEFARPSFREAQTLSHIGAALITGAGTNEQVFAHEIAHQWFGNSLTVRSWEDIWLNESLSEYMAWQWIRKRHGEAAYRLLLDSAAVARAPAPIVPANPSDFSTLFGNATFQRGPAVLTMLERKMGTAAFSAALHMYVGEHAHGLVATADFQKACENAYGKSLADFFAEWIRGTTKLPAQG